MMFDPSFPAAVPVVGWPDNGGGGTEADWLTARRRGLGASEVASALGLPGAYETPWLVWARKTGRHTPEFDGNDATNLGNGLEPWLISSARTLIGAQWVDQTAFRLYESVEHPWLLASPDAGVWSTLQTPADALVECKTAGLVEPFAAREWTRTDVPLRVEVQCRMQMAVLGIATVNWVVGLVAGIGLHTWPVEWNPATEDQLIRAAGAWWETHVVGGAEPAMMPADNATMNAVYPTVEGAAELPVEAEFVLEEYRSAVAEGSAAERRRKELAATLKRMLAGATVGTLNGAKAVTWAPNKNGVRALRTYGG